MSNSDNPLKGKLNTNVPFAPDGAEEVKTRIKFAEEVGPEVEAERDRSSSFNEEAWSLSQPKRPQVSMRESRAGAASRHSDAQEDFTGLGQIAVEIQAAVGELESVIRALPGTDDLIEPVEAADSRSVFTVKIDSSNRIVKVRPNSRWRAKVPADELGSALLDAVQSAVSLRFERWLSPVNTSQESRAETASSVVATTREPPTRESKAPIDFIAVLDELLRKSHALQSATDAVIRDHSGEIREHLYRDHRVLMDFAADGLPSRIDINTSWVEKIDLSQLSDGLNDSFKMAYASFDRAMCSKPEHSAAVSEDFAAISEDPAGSLLNYAAQLGIDTTNISRTQRGRDGTRSR
ncbi:hypothetical protein [Spirillospora sp. NPDC047279]|uniref:hypothetical protein n=1 Tax=Spirillospora sp. NPDC047279 TaxID=3155478 RepID=UPI0033EDF132